MASRFGSECTLIWPLAVNRRAGKTRGSALGFHCRQCRDWYFTPQGEHDAREALATIDHADMRGLVTAFHLSVAGLPRSSIGDHPKDTHITCSRIPPHRVPRIAFLFQCV
jgi:hypothetical protein